MRRLKSCLLFLIVVKIKTSRLMSFWKSGLSSLYLQTWRRYETFERFCCYLKGVFAKNVRGYRLNAIKKRFWSLLILLSVASIRRKLLKRLSMKNVVSIQIQKDATWNSDRKQINLINSFLTEQFLDHILVYCKIKYINSCWKTIGIRVMLQTLFTRTDLL